MIERIGAAIAAFMRPETVAASRFLPQYNENWAVPDIDDLIEERGYEVLREMVERDDMIQSCLYMLTFGVLSTGWQVTPSERSFKGERAAEWARYLLRNMQEYSLKRLVMDSLEAIWMGHVVMEKIYSEPLGPNTPWPGRQGIRTIRPVPQESIRIAVDDFGDILSDGIWQQKPNRTMDVQGSRDPSYYDKHPRDRFVVWSLLKKWNNPYGRSLLRAAWPWYYAKTQALLFWGQHLEHFAVPIPVGTVEKGASELRKQAMYRTLRKLPQLRALVKEVGTEIELTPTPSGSTDSFQAFIRECNDGIRRSLFNPSLMSENSSTGSRSLGNTQQDSFVMTVTPIREFVYEEVVEKQVVAPSVYYNLGPNYPCPNVTPQENDPGRLKSQMELYESVLSMGVPVGRDHIRTVVGVPAPEPGEEEATLVSKNKNRPGSKSDGYTVDEPNPNSDPGEMEKKGMRRNENRKSEMSAPQLDMVALEMRARREAEQYRLNGGSHAGRSS